MDDKWFVSAYLIYITFCLGFNRKTGVIVEQPGKDIVHISGRRILDNHSVNLISSVIMGILTPKIAYLLWPWIVQSLRFLFNVTTFYFILVAKIKYLLNLIIFIIIFFFLNKIWIKGGLTSILCCKYYTLIFT